MLKSLELKLPPPVLAALCGLAMWLSTRMLPSMAADIPASKTLAGGLVLTGLCLDLSGLFAFRQERTTINPLSPATTTRLVCHGIYRHTRNPMYLGLLLFLGAWAVLLAQWPAFLGLPLFVVTLTRLQIQPEERILTAKFGALYTEYTRRVRRWV